MNHIMPLLLQYRFWRCGKTKQSRKRDMSPNGLCSPRRPVRGHRWECFAKSVQAAQHLPLHLYLLPAGPMLYLSNIISFAKTTMQTGTLIMFRADPLLVTPQDDVPMVATVRSFD